MRIRYTVAVLVLAAIAGCAVNPTGLLRRPQEAPGPVEVSFVPPELGIVIDEHYRVVDMEPLGAAAQAGVQIGDILISVSPAGDLPPGTEATLTPYPPSGDVIVLPPDGQGQPIATPIPGVQTPALSAVLVDPALEPTAAVAAATATAGFATVVAQLTVQAATPEVRDPEVLATIEAFDATAVALAATADARIAYESYQNCLNFVSTDPATPPPSCAPPGRGVLTETVFFTDTQRERVKAIIAYSDPPNRMILKVLRDGQELELLVVPGPPAADRPGRDPEATVTPVWPPYDYF